MKVIDSSTGRINTTKDIQFADKVLTLKNTKGVWDVVDEIVSFWVHGNPDKYDSFITDLEIKKSTRRDAFGSNKAKSIRSTLDVPVRILSMIRSIYHADELPFDKKFFNTIWRRYPAFRVSEKL